MKTIFSKWLFVGVFSLLVSAGFAQTSASSREVNVDTSLSASSAANQARIQAEKAQAKADADRMALLSHRSTIPIPTNITNLIVRKKVDDAFKQLEAFKATLKDEDPLQVLLLECEVYDIALGENENDIKLREKREALVDKMKKTYGDRVEVVRFDLDRLDYSDFTGIVEVATRMIEIDSTFLPSYEKRGEALYHLGRQKEACLDYMKLPPFSRTILPGSFNCNEILREE